MVVGVVGPQAIGCSPRYKQVPIIDTQDLSRHIWWALLMYGRSRSGSRNIKHTVPDTKYCMKHATVSGHDTHTMPDFSTIFCGMCSWRLCSSSAVHRLVPGVQDGFIFSTPRISPTVLLGDIKPNTPANQRCLLVASHRERPDGRCIIHLSRGCQWHLLIWCIQ